MVAGAVLRGIEQRSSTPPTVPFRGENRTVEIPLPRASISTDPHVGVQWISRTQEIQT